MAVSSQDTHVLPNAPQLLSRLLELIRSSQTLQDITPDHLHEVMGVAVQQFGPGHYGFGNTLSPQWSYGLEVDQQSMHGPRLDFDFRTALPDSTPATDICQIDFDKFSSELEAMKFAKQVIYGEHDRVIEYRYNRPGLAVTVVTRGEANEPIEKISHQCVHMITIN